MKKTRVKQGHVAEPKYLTYLDEDRPVSFEIGSVVLHVELTEDGIIVSGAGPLLFKTLNESKIFITEAES